MACVKYKLKRRTQNPQWPILHLWDDLCTESDSLAARYLLFTIIAANIVALSRKKNYVEIRARMKLGLVLKNRS